MNTKPLLLLSLTVTLLACNPGAPPTTRPSGSPSPTGPAPTAPGSTAPAPSVPAPTAPGSTGPAGVEGRDFLSASVVHDGAPFALVPNTVIRLGFHDGQLSASAGCNTFGGAYRIDGDRLIVDGGAMTEMGCDDPRHAQDDWLFGLLGADPAIALDGDNLVLTTADGLTVITLLDRQVAEPNQPLVGPTWRLSSIITGDAVSSVPDEIMATIAFKADGGLDLSPGCNEAGGRYTVDGDLITFSDIITTKMACMGARGDVENAFLAVLSAQTVTYTIDAGTLTLMTGNHGLQFSAA